MNNPYTPPEARVADSPSRERGSTLKAVGLGLLTDIGGTLVFSTVLSFIIGFVLAARGMDIEAIQLSFNSTGYQLFGLISGSAFTCLGGYVAARIANHAEYRHGFYLALASMISGEIVLQFLGGESELWLHLAGLILVFPAALYGAHLRLSQKHGAQ